MTGRMETSKTSLYLTYFYVKWTTAQDSINKKTTINWEIHLDTPRESWYSNAVRIDYLKINNTTVKSSLTYSNISHTDYTLASGSNSFSHNSNGDLTLSFSFSGWLYGDGTFTATYSLVLPHIDVCTAAAISSVTSLVAFGGNCTINITKGKNNDNDNCTYKLTYSCNGQTGTALSTSSSLKPSSHLFSTNNFNLIKNNTSNVTCTLTLTTYWNNNSIGSSSKTFDIVIPLPVSNFDIIDLTLLESMPYDWDINKTSYYKLDNNKYIHVDETDEWASNTFYIFLFDTEYTILFVSTNNNYTYKLLDLWVQSGDKITVSSALCVDALQKEITLNLITYNGSNNFSNYASNTMTCFIKDAPTLSIGTITRKNCYYKLLDNIFYFFNDNNTEKRKQSYIEVELNIFLGNNATLKNLSLADTTKAKIYSIENNIVRVILLLDLTGPDLRFLLVNSRNLLAVARVITTTKYKVLDYISLSIKDVKVYNEYLGYNLEDYTKGFYITYNIDYTKDGTTVPTIGTYINIDNITPVPLDNSISNNSVISKAPLSYSGSPLSKTITITASLYDDEPISYTLYLAPQEKALNLYNGNKIIRIGSMAGEVDLYILLTTQPIDWNNNYTYYYKKQYNLLNSEPDDWESNKTNYYKQVNNEYVSVESTDTWATNTYYSLEYVSVESTDAWANNTYYQKRDKWGLVVGNFDLTITDTEIAILKNKFGI